jgi:hypothetical protein
VPVVSTHLGRLGAHARPTGSQGAADARAYCSEVLRGLGFSTREMSFEYSRFGGAYAAPLSGLGVAALATMIHISQSWMLAIIGSGFLAVSLGWLGGRGILDFPGMRRRGVNLTASRGAPRVWMVAHIDSKWQPVSMTMRVAGVIVMSIGLIAVIAAMLMHREFSAIALAVTWLGALPVMGSVVGERSGGTLDNASGVATVLEAAACLPRDANVGVMITDAEELALAGARAWARTSPPGVALNVDCVDDAGSLVVMYTGSAPGEVISRLAAAALDRQESIRVLRLIPGILTDSVALAGAGWRTVTLSRGTIRTLARIHTSRDSLAAMDGRGIEGAARVLAQAADELARGVMK